MTTLVVIAGLLIMVIASFNGWQHETKVWRLVDAKPDAALDTLKDHGCLIDEGPDGHSKSAFTGPFKVASHSVFLKSDQIPSIYRGLVSALKASAT
jgi:hypothetical protein